VANDRLNHHDLLLTFGIAASVLAQILQSKSTLELEGWYIPIDETISQFCPYKKLSEEITFFYGFVFKLTP
jgi:hypothetical protein